MSSRSRSGSTTCRGSARTNRSPTAVSASRSTAARRSSASSDGTVGVAQLAACDERVARDLLCALRVRGEQLSYVNVPEGDPASVALHALGGSLDLRQFEMSLELSSSSSAPRG